MANIVLPHHHNENQDISYIHEQLSNPEDFRITAEIFRQLSDTTRIRIFWLLCHCEECVLNISAMLKMSSPAVSHHLRPLKNSSLIVSRRDGKEVYYRAADTEESRLLHQMIERVMEIACPKQKEYRSEQIELIHRVHDRLTRNISERVTIEALSKEFAVNPTTLKSAFKSVYGNSLAAHIKEHRMELAAKMLRESDASIGEIAETVGYDSQGKFTAAFKSFFHLTPSEYRKSI